MAVQGQCSDRRNHPPKQFGGEVIGNGLEVGKAIRGTRIAADTPESL
jgi:hypothetical protein